MVRQSAGATGTHAGARTSRPAAEPPGAPGAAHAVPAGLRRVEPWVSLALAVHALAVWGVTVPHGHRVSTLLPAAAGALVVLGGAGLLGARSTRAMVVRGLAILALGFVLQAARVDGTDRVAGYFLLWFFVLVSVYPLVLPHRTAWLVAVVTPAAYLVMMPLGAVDGDSLMAPVRALSLAVIGLFVHLGARAYREAVGQLILSEATAQDSLATLQRALLPQQTTAQPGVTVAGRYRSAGLYDQIGGDWYDTIALPDGGLALVIGDVEGHDLTAASVMGLVRGAVRAYALEGHPPAVVLERVNAFLLSADISRLVTMAYVQLYPDNAVATVAVAGHPVPLVVPGHGAPSATLAAPTGPILGVRAGPAWTERTVPVPSGASLVLYTDGLIGFPHAPVDQLEQLMAGVLAVAGEPADRIATALIQAAPRYDDAAVLVAQVRSVPALPAQRTFPAQPISASIARTWIADLFALWQESGVLPAGVDGCSHLEAAQLLLTELVSNAVRHSDQSVRVRLGIVGHRLRVEVADSSERMPVMRQTEVAATEGRGLRLVDAMAAEWGVRLDEHGKVVWFELELGATGQGRGATGQEHGATGQGRGATGQEHGVSLAAATPQTSP